MQISPTTLDINSNLIVDPLITSRLITIQHVNHLADSLSEISQMRPIIVKRQKSSPQFILYDGIHRLSASMKKGLATIQAHIFDENTSDVHVRRCILESDFLTREDSWA